MRAIILGLSLALAGAASAEPMNFDIKGTWAADGRTCAEAASFVEFDGRDVLGYRDGAGRTRVGADYAAASQDGRLVVSLTDLQSNDRDRLTFLVDDTDAIRLDSSFLVASRGPDGSVELMKLTRCSGRSRHLAAKP